MIPSDIKGFHGNVLSDSAAVVIAVKLSIAQESYFQFLTLNEGQIDWYIPAALHLSNQAMHPYTHHTALLKAGMAQNSQNVPVNLALYS